MLGTREPISTNAVDTLVWTRRPRRTMPGPRSWAQVTSNERRRRGYDRSPHGDDPMNLDMHFFCCRVVLLTQATVGQEFGFFAWGNAYVRAKVPT